MREWVIRHPAQLKQKKRRTSSRDAALIRIKFNGNAHRKLQIEGKGRAIQRGLHFLHEALDNGLAVREKIDRNKPLVIPFQPDQAFIGKIIATLNQRDSRRRYGEFTNREKVTAEVVHSRDSRLVGAVQEKPATESKA